MHRPRILIADDHKLVGQGLSRILSQTCEVLAIVEDGQQLVASVKQLLPELVITDLSMPLLDGLEAIRELKEQGSTARFIVMTMYPDAQLGAEAIRAGALGYILKNSSGDELLTAVSRAMRGRLYITPLLADDIARARAHPAASPLDQLTLRQREVLKLILAGQSVKEVADALGLSPRTVETHKYQMMQNVGVRTTVELVEYAFRNGLAERFEQHRQLCMPVQDR